MEQYKSVEFLSNFQNVNPPCTNVKPPYGRLSGEGSVIRATDFLTKNLNFDFIIYKFWLFSTYQLPEFATEMRNSKQIELWDKKERTDELSQQQSCVYTRKNWTFASLYATNLLFVCD